MLFKKAAVGLRSRYAITISVCARATTYRIIGLSESGVFLVPCSIGKSRGFGPDAGSALWRGIAPLMGTLSWPSPSWIGLKLEPVPRRIPQYTYYYARKLIRFSSVTQSEPHRKDTSRIHHPTFFRNSPRGRSQTTPQGDTRGTGVWCLALSQNPRHAWMVRRKCVRCPFGFIAERNHAAHP